MHNLMILHMFNFSMLFHVCEFFRYPCCVTLIEIGGDVLALGIPFLQGITFEVFWKMAEPSLSFWVPWETGMCIYTFQPFWPNLRPAFWFHVK